MTCNIMCAANMTIYVIYMVKGSGCMENTENNEKREKEKHVENVSKKEEMSIHVLFFSCLFLYIVNVV